MTGNQVNQVLYSSLPRIFAHGNAFSHIQQLDAALAASFLFLML
jgi:hypothetical protein